MTRIGVALIIAGILSAAWGLWTLLSFRVGVPHSKWLDILAFAGMFFGVFLVASGGWLTWFGSRVTDITRRRVGRLNAAFLAAVAALVLLFPWYCSIGFPGGSTVCRNMIGMTFPRGDISDRNTSESLVGLLLPVMIGLVVWLVLLVISRRREGSSP